MGRKGRDTADPGDLRPSPDHLTSMTRLVGLYRRAFIGLLAEHDWIAETGAKSPTYGVLSVIRHRGPISQREVADLVGVHASDLVQIMDAIEAQGWVERRRDPEDRRRYRLTITPAGRRTLARYDRIAAQAEDVVLEPLDDEERAQLLRLVSKVVDQHTRNENAF